MQTDITIAALANRTRRRLLGLLAESPLRAGVLADGFAISRIAIFKHARTLKRARLIEVKKKGRERIYVLARKGGESVKALIAELEEIRGFWDLALASVKRDPERTGRKRVTSGKSLRVVRPRTGADFNPPDAASPEV